MAKGSVRESYLLIAQQWEVLASQCAEEATGPS
jgi:hypothetical protein